MDYQTPHTGTANKELLISVVSVEGEEKVCLKVEETTDRTQNQTYSCFKHPKYTRYVNIKRPDGMPLAEIKVFAKKAESKIGVGFVSVI